MEYSRCRREAVTFGRRCGSWKQTSAEMAGDGSVGALRSYGSNAARAGEKLRPGCFALRPSRFPPFLLREVAFVYMLPTAMSLTPELFDEDGLVREFSSWSESLAEAIAQDVGIRSLTDEHWKIIRAMREHYAKLGFAPAMHRVCHDAGIERRQVNDLFGYCLIAWRIAGLPNPGEEGKAYLSAM
jgi:tRNA 2-thiouridine synthesizing protein E